MRDIHVLIADADPSARLCVAELIRQEPDMRAVAVAVDGHEAVARTLCLHPDLLLLDANLPGLDALEVVRQLAQRAPRTAILMMAPGVDCELVSRALCEGAHGFYFRLAGREALGEAIRAMATEWFWLDPAIRAHFGEQCLFAMRMRSNKPPLARLSPSERQVLAGIARGLTNKQIAVETYLSVPTVRNYVSSILAKLAFPHRTGAALYAQRTGLAAPEPLSV